MAYGAASNWQDKLYQMRVANQIDDHLLLMEHPHVYTKGRRTKPEHLIVGPEDLARRGIEVHESDRGGSITYHGPGQLVAYPIVRLRAPPGSAADPIGYLRLLEQVVLSVLREFGIEAHLRPGMTGVWADGAKVASIGVRLSRGVTKHGLAINVDPDLSYFDGIVACGLEGERPTSMSKLLGIPLQTEQVAPVVADKFALMQGARPIAMPVKAPAKPPRPAWLRTVVANGPNYLGLKQIVRTAGLHTVCEEAKCPNIYECWEAREATFLILGDRCTRRCGFCDIATGKPAALDYCEPVRVANAVAAMGLRFTVVTGVERDDVTPAAAAKIWAAVIRCVHARVPGCGVEVLTGDLKGDKKAIAKIVEASPEVFAHNLETVARLHSTIRPGFRYERSLEVLHAVRSMNPDMVTKSNLILGMGETYAEVIEALGDLRSAGVDLVTLGQYLCPSSDHLPVDRWVDPKEFASLKAAGEEMGFAWVEAGPLVRSSYHAGKQYKATLTAKAVIK